MLGMLSAIITPASTALCCQHSGELDLIERTGDWIVSGKESFRDKHIRLQGSLILNEGTELVLDGCLLEITGSYSREHNVEWKGGTLKTRNTTVGGFLNESGTAIHTVFHLYEGLWEATDTVVQYSYGVSFHWQVGKGVLRGTRLKAGPRPDAIILSGEADVKLVDCDFPIGLGVYVDQGGSALLNLEPDRRITAVYDHTTLLPGVDWRLELENTRVERWFLFVRNIGMHHRPAEITLEKSDDLIVSLLGHNLAGRVELSRDLHAPLSIGNVTLKSAQDPVEVAMYAIYLSGDETDVAVTGSSHICELMHRGGRLQVEGTAGENSISIGCTTLELAGDAEMHVRNVHLGRPLAWSDEPSMGEATIADEARLWGSDISVRNVRFHTRDQGSVDLQQVRCLGHLQRRAEGGPIKVEEPSDAPPRDNKPSGTD